MASVPAPIRASLQILATHRALFGGRRAMSEAEITRVIAVFEAQHAKWALVGAHAVGLLTEPRATADFDFIVEGSKLNAILDGLTAAFGDLDANDIGAAIQLKAIDVDLIRSTNHRLFQEALDQARAVGDWKVPRTEVLIALKFLAAVSPWRNRNKRALDIVDITTIFASVGSDRLDRTEMLRLAALVYPDADREFRELLDKIDRGDPIAI